MAELTAIEGRNILEVPFQSSSGDTWTMPQDERVKAVWLTAAPGKMPDTDYVTILEAHGANPRAFILSNEAKATDFNSKRPTRFKLGAYHLTNPTEAVLSFELEYFDRPEK